MSTLTTKIYLRPGNEVRRLELNPNIDTLHSLQAKLKEVHEASPFYDSASGNFDFLIQYLDDENEWITVTTEEEWKVALKVGAALASVDPRAILRLKCIIVRRPKPLRESHRATVQGFPIDFLFAPQQQMEVRPTRCQRVLSRPCSIIGQNQQTQKKQDPFDLENLINSVLGAFFVESQDKSQESSNKGEKKETEEKPKREEKQEEIALVDKKESSQEDEQPEHVDDEAPIIEDVPEQPEKQEDQVKESETISENTKEQEFEYPAQLNSLVAMGFANEDFNKFLLRKNRGDITKTVAQLLEL